MKIILVEVISVNSKLTRGTESVIYTWTSKEDQEYYFNLLAKHPALIMGSKTYEVARPKINLNIPTQRFVLTSHPNKYSSESVPDKLEFTDESPSQLTKRLTKKGFKTALLLGGAEVNASFLKDNLIDEIYVTIEPLIFGQGKSFVAPIHSETSLELISVKKLNKKGTLLLKYRVLKSS